MIKLQFLSQANIGDWVYYRKGTDEEELGRIKSWNDSNVFVVYGWGAQQDNWQSYTGQSTDPDDLTYKNAATSIG